MLWIECGYYWCDWDIHERGIRDDRSWEKIKDHR